MEAMRVNGRGPQASCLCRNSMHQKQFRRFFGGWSAGFRPDPGGRGCLLIRNRDRDRAAVALELEITQDLYARVARVARGASRGAMCRDFMHQERRSEAYDQKVLCLC